MSTRLSSSGGAATGDDPPSEGDPQTVALAFWEAIMKGDTQGAKGLVARMNAFKGGTPYMFTLGTLFDLEDVLPPSASSAVQFWGRQIETKLKLVDPDRNCCATLNKQDGDWFAACTKWINVRKSALACTSSQHRAEDRRVITSGPLIYAVSVPDGQGNKVLSKFIINLDDLPAGFQGSKCEEILLEVSGYPYVWLNLIHFLPTREQLVEWCELTGLLAVRVVDMTETEQEEDSLAVATASRGLDPSSHGGDDRGGSTQEPQASSHEEASDLRSLIEGLTQQLKDLKADVESKAIEVESLKSEAANNDKRHRLEQERMRIRLERVESTPSRSDDRRGVTFEFDRLNEQERQSIINQVLSSMDYAEISARISGGLLNSSDLDNQVQELRAWRSVIEEKVTFWQERIQKSIEDLEASRDSSVVRRSGMFFSGESDVTAVIERLPADDRKMIHLYCLDMISVLYLLGTQAGDYNKQIRAMADAKKAGFVGELESKVVLSYTCLVPPTVLTTIEGKDTTAQGGTKWAPLFSDPSYFEQGIGKTTVSRIEGQINTICDLHNKMIESKFPLNLLGQDVGEDPNPVWHNVLLEQSRLARAQALGFVQSLLPMYKTFLNSGMQSKESWNRVHVFAREVLQCIQAKRVVAAEMTNPSQMLWGSFQASELAEQFRKQSFIQHPMVSSLMCLTSLEREGKSLANVLSKLQSVTDVNENLSGRMDKVEEDVKDVRVLMKKK